LGAVDAFAAPMVTNTTRRNHFSVADAREYLYRALTLRRYLGPLEYASLVAANATAAESAKTQAKYWASALRALGSVVHHIQDMAQPQHTRNDSHGSGSAYETYVNERIRGKAVVLGVNDSGPRRVPRLDVRTFSYPPVAFDTYADFWSTARGDGRRPGSLQGRGMADYSSRGFYTAGTMPASSGGALYDEPPQDASLLESEDIVATDLAGMPLRGGIRLYKARVRDTVTGNDATGVRVAALSLWDEFLQSRGHPKRFALNHYNFEDKINLLLPRAISYSTGLIDYFFRGKLEIGIPAEEIVSAVEYTADGGFDRVKVRVRNATAPITPSGAVPQQSVPQTMAENGSLVAVLRYRSNKCLEYPSLHGAPLYNPFAGEGPIWSENCRDPRQRDDPFGTINGYVSDLFPRMVVSKPKQVPAGGLEHERSIIFEFEQKLPFNAVDVELQVIYRGQLGSEADGIAVGFLQLSEPTFFNFDNFTDCMNGMGCAPGDCPWSSDAGLPFVTSPSMVTVTGLTAGSSARVAFLTRAGLRRLREDNTKHWVANNQDFAYEVSVLIGNTVDEKWPPGVTLKGEMFQSRMLVPGPGMPASTGPMRPMLAWRSKFANVVGECSQESCYADVRQQCGTQATLAPAGTAAVRPEFWTEF
jgi:hypothetical protein